MVSFLMFFVFCANPILITQEVSYIEVQISGNILTFEVSDFTYEGIIVVDVKGTITLGETIEKYVNSTLREVEIKKRSPNDFRLIFKFNSPVKLVSKELSKHCLKIRVSSDVPNVKVSPGSEIKMYSTARSEKVEVPVKVIRETLYVEKPVPVFLRCQGLRGEELSAFLRSTLGLRLNLKVDSVYNVNVRADSREELVRKLSRDGR